MLTHLEGGATKMLFALTQRTGKKKIERILLCFETKLKEVAEKLSVVKLLILIQEITLHKTTTKQSTMTAIESNAGLHYAIQGFLQCFYCLS